MRRRSSKIYISSEIEEFDDFLQIAREKKIGLEIQAFAFPEIMYGNWLDEVIRYEKALRNFGNDISFHNVFFSAITVSEDYRIVEATKEKMKYGFMIAKILGAKKVIAHFSWDPFFRGAAFDYYVEQQLKFWDEFINYAEKENIIILMENTTETRPDYMLPILEKVNSPHFKVNWDIGHSNIFSEIPLEEWVSELSSYLEYIHFHTNNGRYDQHMWNKEGNINFDPIFSKLKDFDLHPIFSTEIYKKKELLNALNFLEGKLLEYEI